MEAVGAFFDEEWDSLSRMFFSEDADFMLQLHGDGLFSNESDTGSFFAAPSIFWPANGGDENVAGVDGTVLCSESYDALDYTNFHYLPQESSNSTTASHGVFPNPSHEFHQANGHINLVQVINDTTDSLGFCLMDHKNSSFIPGCSGGVMDDIICLRDNMGNGKKANAETQQPANTADSGNEMLLKRKFHSSEIQTEAEDRTNNDSSENPKKKSRAARKAPKTKRNVQPKSKKNQKGKEISNEEDEPNSVQNGPASTCYSSEDDSNASQESNGAATSGNNAPALNLNGKARATRGVATDPQSLYARRRRERINERLRILQNLIPNGTKVDISTMLEEAVHYVKFLQLQIKLLSSDDMWMYAPIVYNGLDIGLYGKIFPTL